MKSKFAWFSIMVFGMILLGIPAVYAADVQLEPGDLAYQEAMDDHTDEIDEIAANREAVIEEIAAMWFMDAPGGEEQFRSTLDLAHENQLLAILRAESYEEVKAILGDGMETLGDTERDLVFSPVNPCWAVDTRRGGGGFISNGTVRNYNVHGNLAAQGGSNCPAPRGEPRAALLNVIAVNPNGKGNLNVVPFGVDPRTQGALSVNFNVTAGTNLANTGIIKTAYLRASDISLSANFSGCHAVIIVMGYYYEANDHGTRYWDRRSLNTRSINVGTSFSRIDNFRTFSKLRSTSNVEVLLHTRADAGTFAGGCRGVIFQVRIDNAVPRWYTEAAITTTDGIDFISIFAVFTGLSAGNHTVSAWAKCAPAGTSNGVLLDPAGWGGGLVVKETY